MITERIKPVPNEIVGAEQQGFIKGGDITVNLMIIKVIIEYCEDIEIKGYMVIMDFKKSYFRIEYENTRKDTTCNELQQNNNRTREITIKQIRR